MAAPVDGRQPAQRRISSHTGDHYPARVLVHYLGDDAYQCHTIPPRPAMVMCGPQLPAGCARVREAGREPSLVPSGFAEVDVASTALQLSIQCRTAPQVLVDLQPRALEDSDFSGSHSTDDLGLGPLTQEPPYRRGTDARGGGGGYGGGAPSSSYPRRPGSPPFQRMASAATADFDAAQLLTLVRHRDERPATSREQLHMSSQRGNGYDDRGDGYDDRDRDRPYLTPYDRHYNRSLAEEEAEADTATENQLH